MSDKPVEGATAYVDLSAGPTVYFDAVPTFGVFNHAIQIELAARIIHTNVEGGGTTAQMVGAGHLRCSPIAALHLKDALEKALAMLEQQGAPPAGASVN